MSGDYKSHEELDISEELYDALIWFVDQVDKGVIDDDHGFDMSVITACGTVACIGGWCAIHFLGEKPNKKGFYSDQTSKRIWRIFDDWCTNTTIYELFYARGIEDLGNVNVKAAADTVKYYLSTGKVRFRRFVKEV